MKRRVIAIDQVAGRDWAALVDAGTLQDLICDPDPVLAATGSVWLARLDRPMKGQGGAMLRLAEGLTGFLKNADGLSPGTPLIVQVTGLGEEGKAPAVSLRPMLRSAHVIATPGAPGINPARSLTDPDLRATLADMAAQTPPPEGTGLIFRSACQHAHPAEIAEDLARVVAQAHALVRAQAQGAAPHMVLPAPGAAETALAEWSATPGTAVDRRAGSFDTYGLWEQVRALALPRVDLPGGAWMSIEPTRALVAVDVNTGGDTSPAAALKATLATLRDLPRQLRLRGLGGQVVIDPAPFARKDRRIVDDTIAAALRPEGSTLRLVGWTPLGHIEMIRHRDRPPLQVPR